MKDYQLKGTEKNDMLSGNIGNDLLDGGLGNDLLLGGMGNDTYVFSRGYGKDVIMDSDKTIDNIDTIVLGENITGSDLEFTRVGDSLKISIIGTEDSITVSNYYYDYKYRIEKIIFSDGTIWDKKIVEKYSGISRENVIYNLGFGVIVIEDDNRAPEIIDTIKFGQDITPGNIVFTKTGIDLEISIVGTSDKIIIKNYYKVEHYKIQEIDFFDGTAWNNEFITSYYTYVTGSGVIEGTIGKNSIVGSIGEDKIYGYFGADVIDGKGGNDYLNGGIDGDTYIFNIGYGTIVIDDYDETVGAIDTIKFGEGITIDRIGFIRNLDDLEISIKNISDKLIIKNFYKSTSYEIEKFILNDGSVFDKNVIDSLMIYGTPSNDNISGTNLNEVIVAIEGNDTIYASGGDDTIYCGAGHDGVYDGVYGGLGNDTIYGEGDNDRLSGQEGADILDGGIGSDTLFGGVGDDKLIGGSGNDGLYGEGGSDTYIFGSGFGADGISELDTVNTDIDTIEFVDGITKDNIDLKREMYDLIISVKGTNDSIRISNQFYGNSKIEVFKFSDGTVLDNEILKTLTIYGTASNDNISGTNLNEVIVAIEGNDTIYASGGDDTIYCGAGHDGVYDGVYGGLGNDTIYGEGDNDRLSGQEGADILDGGIGSDTLFGGVGDDKLIGGSGNDGLYGEGGNDTYIFNKGDGADIVYNVSSLDNDDDRLLFNDVNFAEATITKSNADLIIKLNGTTDSVTVSGFFNYGKYSLEEIQFKNGETLKTEDVTKVLEGTYVSPVISVYDINLEKAIEVIGTSSPAAMANITSITSSTNEASDLLLNLNS
ncbi:calcium-binding protein [Clostridium cellulovorans]|uniref:Hemolysin-type calcium-binding region n=1 Tax=Clostridium cellulovorans (strain ATCC 35296 / DSM 3052 / OCM 3 / 743B) TaxID=573061 RepID=D9STS3_CLOC7|nr:calcium-binding protein [Clostridium cellulovorans]ADL52807.1 Hemolysin-type calcium-binding region [Clostridium cellulovorans 743B]